MAEKQRRWCLQPSSCAALIPACCHECVYARMLWALQEKLKPEMDPKKMDAFGTKYYALDTGAVSTM